MIKAEDMYVICRCHTVVDEGDRLAFVGRMERSQLTSKRHQR